MDRLTTAALNMKRFNRQAHDFVMEAVERRSREVVAINRSRVYDRGKDTSLKNIRHVGKPYKVYSRGYERYKRRIGAYQGHVDTSLSGYYLLSLHMVVEGRAFSIEGKRTIKGFDLAAHLSRIYPGHLGLSPGEVGTVGRQIVLPFMRRKLKESL